jgi:DNA-binding transcriptional regulator/RsmH inhibitor MraZ
MKEGALQHLFAVDSPRGLHRVRLDDRGRLKLPRTFYAYLTAEGRSTVFVTCFEPGVLRVYPISAWLNLRAALFAAGTPAARNIHFIAEDRGRDAPIDKLGRIAIHTDLLESFGRGRQEVVLEFFRGRVNIYNQTAYDRQRELAEGTLSTENLLALQQEGLL